MGVSTEADVEVDFKEVSEEEALSILKVRRGGFGRRRRRRHRRRLRPLWPPCNAAGPAAGWACTAWVHATGSVALGCTSPQLPPGMTSG